MDLRITRRGTLAGIAAVLLAACGSDNISLGPDPTVTATGTRTATPTLTPTPTTQAVAGVAGLIVVDKAVGGGADDAIMQLPPDGVPGTGGGFDRGLGGADWSVDDGSTRGTTTDDGRFSITGLTPGRHVIHVTKTVNGNLLQIDIPIVVGDDGSAEVIAEVSWGLVRATSEYRAAGAAMRAVFGPNGAHLITRDGQAVELADYARTLVDTDGDGHFDPQSGSCEELYTCDALGGCGSPDRICLCLPSCPDCLDCLSSICVPRTYLSDPAMCGPDGLCKSLPYRCGEQQSCLVDGDVCTNVSSCLGCDDVAGSACVEPCRAGEPIDIDRVELYGQPDRLVAGQEGAARASVFLSDGTSMDVTWLATWSSAQPTVASVDGWGRIVALSVGSTDITATLADTVSTPLAVQVVARPTLQRIHVQNASCYYPMPNRDDTGVVSPAPPQMDAASLPPPSCQQIVRIGAQIQFMAVGEFDTGYIEDVTDEVTWNVAPTSVGTIEGGRFSAVAAGEAAITASLAGITSESATVTVVSQATVTALSVYPVDWAYQYTDGGPVRADMAPCFECGYVLTLLRGDSVRLAATAHYDTGEWEDVTARVTWSSSAAAVASIDATGRLTAQSAGDASVDATLGTVTSAAVGTHVVNEATLQSLFAYPDGQDRAIGKGEQLIFHAVGYYDVGFERDVTDSVTWTSSDDAIGSFDSAGVFTGHAAGTVTVWAELDGQQSQPPLSLEVYATSELAYCDADNVNRGNWSDDFNRVTLESDCDNYTQPDVAELRFSVTEIQRPGGVFDPCLDLYAYSGDTLVRTIRQEGCGDPFVAPGAPARDEAVLKYQLSAFWDLKDASGTPVAPGTYTIRGVFYLYYDPVVELSMRVNEPGS